MKDERGTGESLAIQVLTVRAATVKERRNRQVAYAMMPRPLAAEP
jgi:hypothetical protein